MPSLKKTHKCTTSPCTYCKEKRLVHMKRGQGLCSRLNCGKYLDMNSSTFCTEHLENESRQLTSRNHPGSIGGSSRTGTITSEQNLYPKKLLACNKQNTHSYTASQNSYTHTPYQISETSYNSFAADPEFDDVRSNIEDWQLRAPSSQAYSSYGASPSLFMNQNYSPSEPDRLEFDNNDSVYQSLDEHEYDQPYVDSGHYSRPLPTATPSVECKKYEYQPWTWDGYHENHPIRDRDSYR
ncbi:hypothetical protein F4805DRAFT_129774 [Annulohypoxylon moriforme]|nr:hypothetical protein F4805DRAFT_129774 [Annulohypoxylon moriforme]